jgi:hypothetical protein
MVSVVEGRHSQLCSGYWRWRPELELTVAGALQPVRLVGDPAASDG